jgi:hypothetical protein
LSSIEPSPPGGPGDHGTLFGTDVNECFRQFPFTTAKAEHTIKELGTLLNATAFRKSAYGGFPSTPLTADQLLLYCLQRMGSLNYFDPDVVLSPSASDPVHVFHTSLLQESRQRKVGYQCEARSKGLRVGNESTYCEVIHVIVYQAEDQDHIKSTYVAEALAKGINGHTRGYHVSDPRVINVTYCQQGASASTVHYSLYRILQAQDGAWTFPAVRCAFNFWHIWHSSMSHACLLAFCMIYKHIGADSEFPGQPSMMSIESSLSSKANDPLYCQEDDLSGPFSLQATDGHNYATWAMNLYLLFSAIRNPCITSLQLVPPEVSGHIPREPVLYERHSTLRDILRDFYLMIGPLSQKRVSQVGFFLTVASQSQVPFAANDLNVSLSYSLQ